MGSVTSQVVQRILAIYGKRSINAEENAAISQVLAHAAKDRNFSKALEKNLRARSGFIPNKIGLSFLLLDLRQDPGSLERVDALARDLP